MDYSIARRAMIDSQIRPNDVTDPRIVAAFDRIPREAFVPKSMRELAYSEMEIETSPGRAMWNPRDFSKLVRLADPRPTDVALVVAAGDGYGAAILGELVETVIAVEADEDVVAETSERLIGVGADRVVMVPGAVKEGMAKEGPYDLILINGAIGALPESFAEQLKGSGRLVCVVGDGQKGRAYLYTKAGCQLSRRGVFDASPPVLPEFEVAPGFVF